MADMKEDYGLAGDNGSNNDRKNCFYEYNMIVKNGVMRILVLA